MWRAQGANKICPPADHDPDIVEPIGEATPVKIGSRSTHRSTLTWVVGLSSASVALIALVAAALFFSEFAATDRDGWQLLQAAGLSFGVPALMVVPYGLVAWWALGRGRASLLWTVLLMLPWAVVGTMWVVIGRFDPLIGTVPCIVALLAMLWVLKEGPHFGDVS